MRRGSTPRGSTRPTPTSPTSVRPVVPRRVLRRPEPDPARGLGQHRHRAETVSAVDRQHRRLLLRPRAGPRRPGLRRRHAVHASTLDVTGGARAATGSQTFATRRRRRSATRGDPTTVIVTDTNKLGLDADGPHGQHDAYLGSLGALADAHRRCRRRRRTARAGPGAAGPGRRRTPTARTPSNLVADAIKEHRRRYLPATPTASTSCIAGGDDVIPFFRYPDVSGLGQESQFEPAVSTTPRPAPASPTTRCSARTPTAPTPTVTIGGATLPVPDLAVGRLVKTPGEIVCDRSTNYLGARRRHAARADVLAWSPATTSSPTRPTRSTSEFATALPRAADRDDADRRRRAPPHADPGTADAAASRRCSAAHHDLVYLAGHFSANDTLAADFDDDVRRRRARPGRPRTAPAQRDAEEHPGAQRGLPLRLQHRRRRPRSTGRPTPTTGPSGWPSSTPCSSAAPATSTATPTSSSTASGSTSTSPSGCARAPSASTAADRGRQRAGARQAGLPGRPTTLDGIDQKAVLQATLYGLPMTGFDAPGRAPLRPTTAAGRPRRRSTGGPGATLGLGDRRPATSTTPDRPADARRPRRGRHGLPDQLTLARGRATASPSSPAPRRCPSRSRTSRVAGPVLRGVGFRGGAYTDTTGLLPLTGAPAIEGSTPNTTFESDVVLPAAAWRRPTTSAPWATSGRTSLILTPAQYRTDADPAATSDQHRAGLLATGLRLFYTGDAEHRHGRQPARARRRAGHQRRPGHRARDGAVTLLGPGHRRPVRRRPAGVGDLDRRPGSDPATARGSRSTWRRTRPTRPCGPARCRCRRASRCEGVRFLVQAANGVGAVGLDTADGDGYGVTARARRARCRPSTLRPPRRPRRGRRCGVTAAGARPQRCRRSRVGRSCSRSGPRHETPSPSVRPDSTPRDAVRRAGAPSDGQRAGRSADACAPTCYDGTGTVIRTVTCTIVNVSAFTSRRRRV